MSGKGEPDVVAHDDELFARVAAILDKARGNVVRAVNSNMVLAYWLIGREIVETIQEGEERAAYGGQVLSDLSKRLQAQYGGGFSVPKSSTISTAFSHLLGARGDLVPSRDQISRPPSS